jgi:hypothetical protein
LKNNQLSISLLLAISFLNFASLTFAQSVTPKWVYVLDGFYDTDITDLEIDQEGNTYVSANYGGNLSLKGNSFEIPRSPHVHGIIVKLDKLGKLIWARPIQSINDNRINDISIAPNGDLLFTGFADGNFEFKGKKKNIKLGRGKQAGEYHHPQFVYAARYSSSGEPIWVKEFGATWGEGLSIAANSKNEVYFDLYHNNYIKDGDQRIDSVPRDKRYDKRVLMIKLSASGEFLEKKLVLDRFGSTYIPKHYIYIDKEDNLYQYGNFSKAIYFTEKDSLSNDAYMEGLDSYLAKYNADGSFAWAKQIGGQNVQALNEIRVTKEGAIYGAGYYYFECFVGDGINVVQKSKFEYKSGSSFFYFALTKDGELDFIRYEEQGQYSTYFTAQSIALDDFNQAHIVGIFNDTVVIDGHQLNQPYRTEKHFYSRWKNDKLEEITTHDISSNSFLLPRKIDINSGQFATGGLYVGDKAQMIIEGKKHKLTLNEHGRSSYIYGGTVPERKESEPLVALNSRSALYLSELKPLLACISPREEASNDVWFPTKDSLPSRETWLSETPCGRKVNQMEVALFPNPSRGATTLKLKGMEGGFSQIDVFSEQGKLMFSQRVSIQTNDYELGLNLSSVAAGIYFVRIVHGGFEKALRFVKID